MWSGGKKPGGYTDTVYRSRQSKGFEAKSRCCCFYFTRSILILFLLVFLISAGGLSAVSIIFGYSQRWLYNVNRNVSPAYSIRVGWLYFSDNRMSPGSREELKLLSKASYILGLVAMILSSLSVLLAAVFALRSLCGRVGRGFICFSIPFSILLIGGMGAFYIVTALEVWQYQDRKINSSRVAWPDWAWGLGAGSALLWFLAAGIASVLPKRHKYLDVEEDVEPSRISPVQPYGRPVQGTPVQLSPRDASYVPSTPEPPMPTPLNPPMAAQEHLPAESGQSKKKGFMPSWSRRSKPESQDGGAAFDAPAGSYRSRADEIASRYRSKPSSGSVEMGASAPPVPKSAW